MKGLAVLLIVGGAGLGVYAFGYDGGSAFQGAAIVCVVVGVLLFFVSAFVESKKKSVMSQMQQFSTGAGGPMNFSSMSTSGGLGSADMESMQKMMGSANVQNMMGMDAMAILSSVMDAQKQSNGDPEQMAKMLQEKFGGQSVVVNGDSNTTFDLTSQVFGSASASSPSNDLLNQLIKLRDSGAISNEQFEQQKERLIDS